ncbi:MAG TPA: acyloxyacyl hydrolase [Bacteroidia bacterium]|nr:acyloxyacyl hydrolase [Bacteroidia bacterium]
MKQNLSLRLFALLFFLSCEFIFAQDHYYLEARGHYGFIIPHSPRIEHLAVAHTKGFQLDYGKQTTGKIRWHENYNYPKTGFSLVYLDFGNPDVLGTGICILPYIDLPLVRNDKFLFSLRLAEGLGYTTKKFEVDENHKNTAIGSKLNACIQIFFQTSYKISRSTDFKLSLGLTHFSNGSYSTPNIGINNASLSSGIVFYFDTTHSAPLKKVLPPPDKKIQYEIIAAAGAKEVYPAGGKKYFAWTFSAGAFRPMSNKYRLGIGTDLLYDLSLTELLSRHENYSPEISDRFRTGIYFSNELIFGRLITILQMGVYVYYPYKDDGNVYHRIGFKYLCSKHVFVNITLRTHYAKADNGEWGMGYRF